MKEIDLLISSFENRKLQEKLSLEKIHNGEDLYYIVPFLEGDNIIFALNDVYIRLEYQQAKTHFYKAASVAEYMSKKYDARIIDSGINQISYALLSDSKELIERYAILKNTINHELNIGFQLPNAVQNILLNNWDNLVINVRNLERFVEMPRSKWWAATTIVINGFLNKNIEQIEMGLTEMLKTHKRRNTDPLISKFISIDTTGFCKLAWIKGYEIDLKSSLVPKELMPIRPLEKYDDYDFLKE